VWLWHQAEPFGNTVPDENPSGLGIFDLPLRLPGQRYDAETGLYYNYYRDYDPSMGRYEESDPIGLRGGINTYAYVQGNALSYADPTGQAAQAVVVGGLVLIAGAALSTPAGQKAMKDAAQKLSEICSTNNESCKDHLQACYASGWGGTVDWGSACLACFRRCQGTGQWPDSVTSGIWGQIEVSCEYWLRRIPR
jgi:RHS repeat-associated protein